VGCYRCAPWSVGVFPSPPFVRLCMATSARVRTPPPTQTGRVRKLPNTPSCCLSHQTARLLGSSRKHIWSLCAFGGSETAHRQDDANQDQPGRRCTCLSNQSTGPRGYFCREISYAVRSTAAQEKQTKWQEQHDTNETQTQTRCYRGCSSPLSAIFAP